MTNAIIDENRIPVLLALSYVDGTTLVPIQINSTTGGVVIDNTHSVSTAARDAARDENHVPTLMGVDSVSGNPIPVFADPVTGGVLVDVA